MSGTVAPITIGFVVRETGLLPGGFAFMTGALLLSTACFVVLDRMITSASAGIVGAHVNTADS